MKSSTLSLPHDESALLDGMDEDGSFIGDVTFAIDDRSDVVNIWRETGMNDNTGL